MMFLRCRAYLLSVFSLVFLSQNVLAADRDGIEVASWLRAFPVLAIEGLSDSNLYWTAENEESVAGLVVYPELELVGLLSQTKLIFKAGATVGDYNNGSLDDYVDSELLLKIEHDANSRNKFGGGVSSKYSHDAFGTRRTRDLVTIDSDLDEYQLDNVNFNYRFGAINAKVNFEYRFDYVEKEYETNLEAGAKFLNFEKNTHTGQVLFNKSPKSSIAIRASASEIEHPNTLLGQADRDAQESRLALGAIWRASAKTSGMVYFGYIQRDPKSDAQDDFSALDWDVAIEWRPRVTTIIELRSGRETEESYVLNANFIDIEKYSLSWRQQLGQKLSASYKIEYADIEFEGIDRGDEFLGHTLLIEYSLTRKTTVYTKALYSERDSSEAIREFEKQQVAIGLQWNY